MKLVLASTSPYKAALLRRLGIAFTSAAHGADESATSAEEGVLELTVRLAEEKARSVLPAHPDGVVLGCDQLVELDGAALGKPGSAEGARAQLAAMAGRTHRLITSVAAVSAERRIARTVVMEMTMRALSDAEIARYVDLDDPVDCAGSYKIERAGIALFDGITGGDVTAIEGLPLMAVSAMLREHGFHVP